MIDEIRQIAVIGLAIQKRHSTNVSATYSTSFCGPDWTAGPKVANFDRIEWNIITDPATSSAAIQSGEEDWWQTPTVDLLPLLRKAHGVVVNESVV